MANGEKHIASSTQTAHEPPLLLTLLLLVPFHHFITPPPPWRRFSSIGDLPRKPIDRSAPGPRWRWPLRPKHPTSPLPLIVSCPARRSQPRQPRGFRRACGQRQRWRRRRRRRRRRESTGVLLLFLSTPPSPRSSRHYLRDVILRL